MKPFDLWGVRINLIPFEPSFCPLRLRSLGSLKFYAIGTIQYHKSEGTIGFIHWFPVGSKVDSTIVRLPNNIFPGPIN